MTETGDRTREDLASLHDRVDRILAEFLEERIGRWQEAWGGDRVGRLVRDLVLGDGKRLRPSLCYWGWCGAGGADDPPVLRAAASLELFHAFTLVHDDIMDGSATRRGKPSLHRAVAEHARDEGDRRADAEQHGTNIAILMGDLLLTWSDELFHTAELAHRQRLSAMPALQRMREETVAGQYLDLRQQADGGSLASALRVAHYKSARYTVQRPLEIGARLAEAGPELITGYERFGIPLGEAFQLRDDVLGVFGDSATTGKPAADDLREGKPTALMTLAGHKATPGQAGELERLHGNPDLDESGADVLRSIARETGALETVEQLIAQRTHEALDALDELGERGVTAEAHRALRELAVSASARTR